MFVIFGEYHTTRIRDLIEAKIREIHAQTPFSYLLSEEVGEATYSTPEEIDDAIDRRAYGVSDRSLKLAKELGIPVVGIDNWSIDPDWYRYRNNAMFNTKIMKAREGRMLQVLQEYEQKAQEQNIIVLLGEPHVRKAGQLRSDPTESAVYGFLKNQDCILYRYVDYVAADDDVEMYKPATAVTDIYVAEERYPIVDTAVEAVGDMYKNPNRKKVENYILRNMSRLDRTGLNTKRYKELFTKMDDNLFDRWMREMADGRKKKLIIYVPNMIVKVEFEDILKVAEDIDLKLFERVKLWDATTKRYFITPQKYLIADLPARRLKQYRKSKVSIPESDTVTDLFTGQVIKPDKGSSISMVEFQTMVSKGLLLTATEFANPRGGNIHGYAAMKASLEETGEVRLSDIDQGTRVRSAVVANAFLTSMLLESNF